jgi:SAM-dependent methyltransferase
VILSRFYNAEAETNMADKTYRWLAQYYDLVFSGNRSPIDVGREQILGPILPSVSSACDLACGTGTTALGFARRDIRMFAVDVSPGMCRAAREKVARAGLPVRVIRADMRDFSLPAPVDLVICEGDALNHVARRSDLRVVAKAVSCALNPGGYFYFDINNRSGFKRYWTGVFWIEKPGVVLVMRNGNDYRRNRAWCDVEWFVKEGSLWRRHQEHVEEVCWTRDEVRSAITAAGFDRLNAVDAARFFKGEWVRPGDRTMYLARKAAA